MKTTDEAFAGWTIINAGTYPSGPNRYRLDRHMADQRPPIESEGHFDTIGAALRHGNTFNVGNADDVRIWDLNNDRIVAKKIFV